MAVFNTQKAIEAGYTPEQIQAYVAQRKSQGVNLSLAQPKQQAVDMPKKRGTLQSLLPLLGGIAGSVAGAPLGLPGIIALGAAGSGLGEFGAQKFSGEDVNPEKIAGETVLGGIGGAGGKLFTRLFGGGAQALAREGTRQTLQKGTKLGTGKIEELLQGVEGKQLKFTGSAYNKAKQAEAQRKTMGVEREKALEKFGSAIPKVDFKKGILDRIKESDLYESGNKGLDKEITHLLSRIDKISGDTIDSNAINKLKTGLNSLTKNAYNKYKAGDISTLTTKQRAAVGMQQAIDELLPGTVKDEGGQKIIAELTKKMGYTYPFQEAYEGAARRGVQIPVPFLGNVSMGVASRPVQALGDTLSRTTARAGSSGLAGSLLGQSSTRALAPSNEQNVLESAALSPSSSEEIPSMPQENKMQDLFKLLVLQDLAQTGGDNITKLVAASQFLQPKSDLSATQEKRMSALQQAEGIYGMVENLALNAGTGLPAYLKSKVGQLPGVEGGSEEDLGRVTEALAKGIAGVLANEVGVATDKDIARWMGLMPKVTDTLDERKRALARLKNEMGRIRQTLGE